MYKTILGLHKFKLYSAACITHVTYLHRSGNRGMCSESSMNLFVVFFAPKSDYLLYYKLSIGA